MYPIAILALRRKRWRLGGITAAVIACHLLWIAPDFASAQPTPEKRDGTTLRIFSSNLLMVHPNPYELAAEVLESQADILLLQEYSPRWQETLREMTAFDHYPHRVGVAREDSFGTIIFSKLPLESPRVWDVAGLPMTRARIQVGIHSIELVNVHTLPPRLADYIPTWRAQMDMLIKHVKQSPIPIALIGDFNATQHSEPYRRLISAGLYDAHRDRGRGYASTFPNGLFPLPPIRIDHALLSNPIRCLNIQEGLGNGSDHRPLIIDLWVPNQ